MKEKEKAQELHDLFFQEILSADTIENIIESKYVAKICANICVDKIIGAIGWHKFEVPNKEYDFWFEVKRQIEKL